MTRITIEKGDLTKAAVDAIVNAANEQMLGGGGVDGAIHRAAGPQLRQACERVPARDGVRCPTGQARITPGFDLVARYVIHTVGPIYTEADGPAELLRSAFRSSLELAESNGIESIAFPAISCGVYAFPIHEAADIAIDVAMQRAWALEEIRFVLFGDEAYEAWSSALARCQDSMSTSPPRGEQAS